MPSIKNHILLRGATYHVRLDIPQDLRAALGNRRILSRSLRTGDKTLAKELAATQLGQWKSLFRALREEKIRRGEHWREEAFESSKSLAGFVRDWTLELSGVAALPSPTAEQIVEAKHSASEPTVQEGDVSGGDSFSVRLDGKSLAEQIAHLKDFQAWAAEVERQRLSQQYRPDPKELKAILADHHSYKPKSPITQSLQDRFASHFATQSDNERTRSVAMAKISTFSDWLTTEAHPLTFDSVATFLDTLGSNRQTRQGYLWALRKLHKWACRYDQQHREQFAAYPSPFEGHEHPRVGKSAGGSWAAFTGKEAGQLYRAAKAKADTDLADLIAFACYTGCRIEELGRISASTTIFDQQGKPMAFRVDDAKTSAGIREIPIAEKLLPLYRKRLELAPPNNGYLFAGNDNTKSGIRLNALSQRFTKLKRAEGFGDQHVFHSFRKLTATALEQAGAPALTIPSILGHVRGSLTFDVYSQGASMEQKRQAIELLTFDFP